MKTTQLPIFLDVEASSLNFDSYPIEIAWSYENGEIESFLIKVDDIQHWTDWNMESHMIHNITREQCIKEGVSPYWLADRMNRALSGCLVYSDCPEFDAMWVGELYRAVGDEPKFDFADIHYLWRKRKILKTSEVNVKQDLSTVVEVAYEEAQKIAPHTHRARDDVRHLQEWYKLILKRTTEDSWGSKINDYIPRF